MSSRFDPTHACREGSLKLVDGRCSVPVPLTVVYDGCVLYPAGLWDVLSGVGQAGLVHVRWTERIPDECFRPILRDRPDLGPKRLQRTRKLIGDAVRDVLVEGCDTLVVGLELLGDDDRHVLESRVRSDFHLRSG